MRKRTVVLTVLDCGMMERKKGLARLLVKWLYFTLPIRSARFVTAISEATKTDIVTHTGCPAGKVTVIPIAVDSIYEPCPQEFHSVRPKILQIGTGYNKNIFRLAEALNGLDCDLTIVGELSSDQEEALGRNNVVYTNMLGISREAMRDCYIACDILAFVSTFEGFGMPIIEANCVERVVLTSNISSMPEIAGDAAHLVDPFDAGAIRDGLIKLIAEATYRDTLIDNGRRNKLRFDGDKIAKSYFELYMTIIGDGSATSRS